ncbi:MAG: hypothetical protein KF782_23845, partial [Labilithrix sp.]|nr:hypothetical protein [Labilithrix sp.]
EAIAQSGRLRAQLEGATRDAKEEPARTSTAAVTDAGARAPAKAGAKDGAPAKPDAKDGAPAPKTNADGGAR